MANKFEKRRIDMRKVSENEMIVTLFLYEDEEIKEKAIEEGIIQARIFGLQLSIQRSTKSLTLTFRAIEGEESKINDIYAFYTMK